MVQQPKPRDTRARQPRAVATRAAIVEAAAHEFDERGYVGASMDGVAERAGVTKGALYFHFASKADLAGAVIVRQHEVTRAYGDAAVARSDSPLESVVWLTRALAVQMTSEVVVSAGIRLSTDPAATGVERRDPYGDWLRLVTGLVQQAVDAGEVDPRWDPESVARVVNAAFTGVHTVSSVLSDRADLHDRLRELWTVLLAALVTDRLRPEVPRITSILDRPWDD